MTPESRKSVSTARRKYGVTEHGRTDGVLLWDANERDSMKIFISSLIRGFEPYRAAARDAVTQLGYEPVMAEDFPAQPNSPQVACLQGCASLPWCCW